MVETPDKGHSIGGSGIPIQGLLGFCSPWKNPLKAKRSTSYYGTFVADYARVAAA